MDKSLLLLGQVFQLVAYRRRYNAPCSVMRDHKKLKEILREKSELLANKTLNAIWRKVSKSMKSYIINKGKSQQPIPSGPPLKKNASGEQKISFSRRATRHERSNKKSSSSGKIFNTKGTSLQHTLCIITGSLTFSKGFQIEVLFSKEIPSKLKLAGRQNHFLMNWKKLIQDWKMFSVVEGYQIPFLREPEQN